MKTKKIIEKIDKRIRLTDQLTDDLLKFPDLLDQHLKPCGDDLTLLKQLENN